MTSFNFVNEKNIFSGKILGRTVLGIYKYSKFLQLLKVFEGILNIPSGIL